MDNGRECICTFLYKLKVQTLAEKYTMLRDINFHSKFIFSTILTAGRTNEKIKINKKIMSNTVHRKDKTYIIYYVI